MQGEDPYQQSIMGRGCRQSPHKTLIMTPKGLNMDIMLVLDYPLTFCLQYDYKICFGKL